MELFTPEVIFLGEVWLHLSGYVTTHNLIAAAVQKIHISCMNILFTKLCWSMVCRLPLVAVKL
jgi:hypothetical protein